MSFYLDEEVDLAARIVGIAGLSGDVQWHHNPPHRPCACSFKNNHDNHNDHQWRI